MTVAPSYDAQTDEYYWPVPDPRNPRWPGKVVFTSTGRVAMVGISNPLPADQLVDLIDALTAAKAWREKSHPIEGE